jgi:hypothetical protein
MIGEGGGGGTVTQMELDVLSSALHFIAEAQRLITSTSLWS